MAYPDKKPLPPPPVKKPKFDWSHFAHEAAAVFCMIVVVVGFALLVSVIAKKEIARVVHPPPIPMSVEEARQKIANTYFRLGVSCSAMVITEHKIAGEQIPDPDALLKESKAYVNSLGGEDKYLK